MIQCALRFIIPSGYRWDRFVLCNYGFQVRCVLRYGFNRYFDDFIVLILCNLGIEMMRFIATSGYRSGRLVSLWWWFSGWRCVKVLGLIGLLMI